MSLSPSNIPIFSSNCLVFCQNALISLNLSQVFLNTSDSPISAHYSFPSLKNITLVSLTLVTQDGSILTAKIREAEESKEKFQDAVSSGNTALTASISKDKLQMIVGNIQPGDKFEVKLSVTYPASVEDSYWKILIPRDFYAFCQITPEFEFSFTVANTRPISKYSSNCELAFSLSDDKLNLSGLARKSSLEALDEFWIKYQSERENVPSCLVEKYGDRFYSLVSFIPSAEDYINLREAEGLSEFLFLLDRSGSMSGKRIELAKKAAILFLKSLPEGSLFNIVSFGSSFQYMFPKSVENTSDVIESSLKIISSFEADMGGTNIYLPLENIFSKDPVLGFSKVLFLLTDGEVDDPKAVVKLIKKNSLRVNSFGIGEDFDKDLIRKSAEAGKGISNFVTEESEIGKKVVQTLSKCLVPALSSWEILWNGENYPKNLGTLVFGDRFISYSQLTEPVKGPVLLKAFDNSIKSFRQFELSEFQETEQTIYKLWANEKIKDLLKDESKNAEEIKKLSIESGIPTKFTSLYCEKENALGFAGDVKEITIKRIKEKKNDRGDSDLSMQKCYVGYCLEEDEEECMELFADDLDECADNFSEKEAVHMSVCKEERLCKEEDVQMLVCKEEDDLLFKKDIVLETQNKTDKIDYMSIITSQKSAGFWEYSKFSSEQRLFGNVPADLVQVEDKENVICTLMVLAYLHKHFGNDYDEWFLIEKKAVKWLSLRSIDYKSLESRLLDFI